LFAQRIDDRTDRPIYSIDYIVPEPSLIFPRRDQYTGDTLMLELKPCQESQPIANAEDSKQLPYPCIHPCDVLILSVL
jgi:hypothetical protein